MQKKSAAKARRTTPYSAAIPGNDTRDMSGLQSVVERSQFDNRTGQPLAQPIDTTPAQTTTKTVYIGGSQTGSGEQIPGPAGPPGATGANGQDLTAGAVRRVTADYTVVPGDSWIICALPGETTSLPTTTETSI